MENPEQVAQSIFDAANQRNWWAVFALALVFAVFLLRKFSPKMSGKLGALLNSDRGGAALSAGLSVIGAMATALLAHQPITFKLVTTALTLGAGASGARDWAWHLLAPADKVPIAATPPMFPPDPPKAA